MKGISIRKLFQQTFEEHKGRPGAQGGSLPRSGGGSSKKDIGSDAKKKFDEYEPSSRWKRYQGSDWDSGQIAGAVADLTPEEEALIDGADDWKTYLKGEDTEGGESSSIMYVGYNKSKNKLIIVDGDNGTVKVK